MGASSVTGVSGLGVSGKATSHELSMLANGPSILVSGRTPTNDGISSPAGFLAEVTFPKPLPGPSEGYVVILTSLNGGWASVSGMIDDADGNFSGFLASAQYNGDVMYIVTRAGVRV